jgi:undecaprenyl diphosphate synthase
MNTVQWVAQRNIQHLAVFAFSSENWGRSEEEVAALMELMAAVLAEETEHLAEIGVRVRIIGERKLFSATLQGLISSIEEKTSHGDKLTLWVCLSYGSRAEIVDTARSLLGAAHIDESTFASHLWTSGMPDPDIIIRTGGRHRLSNFLLWQAAYSELFFLDTLWPDFSERELDGVLEEFAKRTRTFGI